MMFTRIFNFCKTSKAVFINFSTKVNIIKSKAHNIEIPKIPLYEYLWKNLEQSANKTAVICSETQRSYTYQQLHDKSFSLTKFLKDSLKLMKNDIVSIVLPNIPEYPIVLLGAVQAGLKVTTCNPNYTVDEMKKQLVVSESKLIFTSNDLLPLVQKALSTWKNIPIIVIGNETASGTISFNEVLSSGFCQPSQINVEDTVFLPYSSGTTGLPKGVELTHYNIVSNLCQVGSPEFNVLTCSNSGSQDIVPAFLPFFHIYGLTGVLLRSLAMRAKLVTMPKFSSDNFIKILKNYQPTVIFGVPLVVNMIINDQNIVNEDLENVTSFVCGAAPLGAADVEKFHIKTKNKINLIQGFGMSETILTTLQTKNLKNGIKIGGSGFLLPNTCGGIIPFDGSVSHLGPNQTGELIIKGPQVMKGYYKNPEATKEIFLEDGWIKTGDVGHYDEDGHFYITDRLKELIKVKGFQVAPAELEEILRGHPSVEDVAVVGIPHPILGEVPKAFVVSKPNTSVKSSQLQEFVAAKVSKHKHLTGGVVFIDAITKNPAGKILRRELKKL